MTEFENAMSNARSGNGKAHPSAFTRTPARVSVMSRLQRTTRPCQSTNHQDLSVPPTSMTLSVPASRKREQINFQRLNRSPDARLPERRSESDCRTSQVRRPTLSLGRHINCGHLVLSDRVQYGPIVCVQGGRAMRSHVSASLTKSSAIRGPVSPSHSSGTRCRRPFTTWSARSKLAGSGSTS